MKSGYSCIVAGTVAFVATLWMMLNGTAFIHGIVVSLLLVVLGLFLVRRARRLQDIQGWAREHPAEAEAWLKSTEGKEGKDA